MRKMSLGGLTKDVILLCTAYSYLKSVQTFTLLLDSVLPLPVHMQVPQSPA